MRPRPPGLCAAASLSLSIIYEKLPALADEIETIAELRTLYRSAEARAGRLRLLSDSANELAAVELETFDAVFQQCANRLAFFVGHRDALVTSHGDECGFAIPAPGQNQATLGYIKIGACLSLGDIEDIEDREAVQMHVAMMGVALDRMMKQRERLAILERLKERETRLAQLIAQMFSIQEDERRRVSRELHDGVAQTASALFRMLEGNRDTLDEPLDAASRSKLAGIAKHLVGELRLVIAGLRPTILDDLGLEAGIGSLAKALESEGFDVRLAIETGSQRLPPAFETALYRIAQEALNNVRKHAGGSCRVEIILCLSNDGTGVLTVSDTGGGTGVSAPLIAGGDNSHIGIDSMRERMAAIGGRLDWRSNDHGGVTVTAVFTGHSA